MAQKFNSVAQAFIHQAQQSAERVAYQFPATHGWASLTWRQTEQRVRAIASGLRRLGLGDEDRTAILSSTRIEWVLADLAIMCAGGATTTVYPSSTAEESAYIIGDSAARFVFAEDAEQVSKLAEKRGELPNLEKVIVFDGDNSHDGWVMSFEELEQLGKNHAEEHPEALGEVIAAITPDRLATLIYTSGTTGRPKGVELTHDCWMYEGEATEKLNILSPDDHQYLWLPLSHSFGKMLQSMQLWIGFRTTVDGRIPKLVENLGEVKPTFMAAPPRIFEKVYNKVVTGMEQEGGLKLKIFNWSLGIGRQVSALKQQGKQPTGLIAAKSALADKLVFSKIKARFGGRVRFFISGSAPLSRDMAEFFHAADILILEGYGLTETSAGSFVNSPHDYKFGTVGHPLPGTEVRIAEDGEILIKGRGVMRAYHNMPEETAEILEGDWLHTGDIGEIDEDGFLRITDRKKDLIKTSGGKYIAPQKIESRLKALWPYTSQVLVHGDNRNYCTALVTLDEENIHGWAHERGIGQKSIAELAEDPQVYQAVQDAVDRLNQELASYETIKKFAILPKDLTVEDDELTPSMKVKRKAVERKYKHILDSFYEGTIAQTG